LTKSEYKLKFLPEALEEWNRLVYYVEDDELVVIVVSIDKREDLAAYKSAVDRLK